MGFFRIDEDPNNVEVSFTVGECIFQGNSLIMKTSPTPTRTCYERLFEKINVRSNQFWSEGIWIHIVIVFEGSSIRIYKDGALASIMRVV